MTSQERWPGLDPVREGISFFFRHMEQEDFPGQRIAWLITVSEAGEKSVSTRRRGLSRPFIMREIKWRKRIEDPTGMCGLPFGTC